MADLTYNKGREAHFRGTLSMSTDTINVAFVSTAYVADKDHEYFKIAGSTVDPATLESTGAGYSTGGAVLASKASTYSSTGDLAIFDAANSTWGGLDIGTIGGAVIYKVEAATSDAVLIAYINSTAAGFPLVTNGGDLTIQWSTGGILTMA